MDALRAAPGPAGRPNGRTFNCLMLVHAAAGDFPAALAAFDELEAAAGAEATEATWGIAADAAARGGLPERAAQLEAAAATWRLLTGGG
jgi:hypothetical protein